MPGGTIQPGEAGEAGADALGSGPEGGGLDSDEIRGAIPAGADAFDVAGRRMSPDDLEAESRFCNESFYLFDPRALSEGLQRLTRRPGRDEEYLTDIINTVANPTVYDLRGEPAVCPVPVDEAGQIQGFNTPDQLMAIEHYMSRALFLARAKEAMTAGKPAE